MSGEEKLYIGGIFKWVSLYLEKSKRKGNAVWLVVQQGQLVVMERMMMISCYQY